MLRALATAVLVPLLLLGLALPASAAVDQALLDKADALLAEGKAEEAYQLLEPHEAAAAGDALFDFTLATAALESGRPSKALFIHERILAANPSYLGVRADMGRAYFALGDYGRAKIEFETLLAIQNLSPDLRRSVEQYAKAAEARAQQKDTVWTGYLEMGAGRDSNIGSSTSLSVLDLPAVGAYVPPAPTGRQTADSYLTYGAGGEVNHRLDGQWSLYAGADYRARGHRSHGDSNNWTFDTRAGASYSGGAWLLRGGLTYGEYFYQGERLRDSFGATADWRMALDPSTQVTLGGAVSRNVYVAAAQSAQDSETRMLSAGWLRAFGDGTTVLNLTGTVGIDQARGARDDGDRRFLGPRATLQKSFGAVGAYVSSGITFSRHSGINSLYLMQRRETLIDVSVGATWSLGKGFSLRPQLAHIRNQSNAELYSYRKTDVSLNLRFDF